MTALKYPTMRSHLAKLEDILISPVFVHLSGPAVNRKSFILPLLSRRPKVATPIPLTTQLKRAGFASTVLIPAKEAGLDHPSVALCHQIRVIDCRKLPPPHYVIVRERGPEHSKTFTIEVRLGRDWVGQAEGLSKKSAAQNAARDVLTKLMEPGGAG